MTRWKRVAGITLAVSAAIAALLGTTMVYSGWYDISATRQHTAFVYHLLELSLRQSVERRAPDVLVPALDSTGRAVNGFKHFRAHCVQCHGAPGVAPEPFARGLTPAPASLVPTSHHWTAGEIYWVIRHGIKMTGMPAWQYRMDDEEIWDVVAFMKILPDLSPADYEEWDRHHPGEPAHSSINAPALPGRGAGPGAMHSTDLRNGDVALGDIAAGRQALQQYLCVTCHVIPDIVGANHHVGPPLAGIADRQYIAGMLPNTPANMLRWIRDPTQVNPLTAMPDLDVSEQDARDIAAFLYTLSE